MRGSCSELPVKGHTEILMLQAEKIEDRKGENGGPRGPEPTRYGAQQSWWLILALLLPVIDGRSQPKPSIGVVLGDNDSRTPRSPVGDWEKAGRCSDF